MLVGEQENNLPTKKILLHQ